MEVQRSMIELDHTQLGINIRTARIRRGLRQKELAELVHITSQHISHIETARTKVSLPTLVDIANALNVDVGALLQGDLSPMQGRPLDAQIADILSDTTPEFKAHIFRICQEEVIFERQARRGLCRERSADDDPL